MSQVPQSGLVLACFTRAWDLLTASGQVWALAWAGIPDGPFNILLDRTPDAALPAGTRYFISGTRLLFAPVAFSQGPEIETAAARVWNPQPDWAALAAAHTQILAGLPLVAQLLAGAAHAGGILPQEADLSNVQAGAAGLASWRTYPRQALGSALTALCGLGPGLTPAGDDWLAGWLLALRLCEATDARCAEQAETARWAVRAAAATRTTTLSQAFLACAAAGEADADWHSLLHALAAGAPRSVEAATRRILAHGATSGAAMLAGFIVGLQVERTVA